MEHKRIFSAFVDGCLPEKVHAELYYMASCGKMQAACVNEIRLRADAPASVTCDGVNLPLSVKCTGRELSECVTRLCGGSVSSLEKDFCADQKSVWRLFFMGLGELLILAVGVSMDAFAVSICKGLAMKKAGLKEGLTCGIWFGGFQALMPLIGYFLGTLFAEAIEAIDHWVAFVLLGIIGFNMLKEAFSKCECEECGDADLSVKTMFVMAVATSIDALAVGISLAMAGLPVGGIDGIFAAVLLIGLCTCGFCTAGVKIGNIFGSRFEKKAQLAGGLILILLGTKILLEHLGILA